MTISGGGRTGGEVLADALLLHGVDMAFAVCGESFLPLLDALLDRPKLRLISCRHEAGAAVMAEASAKLTGRPGVCLVSRGPGACHATIGLHTAFQDATPLVLLVGQVPRSYLEREAQQEIEYRTMFGPLAKWVAEINQVERIPELVHRAFRVAASGRPGPVVLVLPEDMLEDRTAAADCPPAPLARAHPGREELAALRNLLDNAERPIVIVGGAPWSDAACDAIVRFAAANDLPVCCSYRRLDLFPSRHDSFVGELAVSSNPALLRQLREADVVVAIGTRLSEPTTQDYTLMSVPVPRQKLVHVYSSAEEIGSVYRPTVAIQSGLIEFAEAIAGMTIDGSRRWSEWRRELRSLYIDDATPPVRSTALRSGTGDGVAAGTLAPRCDRHVRRWRIHWLAAAIPVVRTAGSRTCTDQWCDELRIARGHRRKPLRTRACRGRMRRRRRLHDERGRARDGTPLRGPFRRPAVQQRPVRQCSRSSGASLSWKNDWNGPDESRIS